MKFNQTWYRFTSLHYGLGPLGGLTHFSKSFNSNQATSDLNSIHLFSDINNFFGGKHDILRTPASKLICLHLSYYLNRIIVVFLKKKSTCTSSKKFVHGQSCDRRSFNLGVIIPHTYRIHMKSSRCDILEKVICEEIEESVQVVLCFKFSLLQYQNPPLGHHVG